MLKWFDSNLCILFSLRVQLYAPKEGYHVSNELDKLTLAMRKEALENVKNSAKNLRENATDVEEAISEVENLLQMLKNIAIEVNNKCLAAVLGSIIKF